MLKDKFFKKTKPNNKCGHLMLFLLLEDRNDIRLPLSNFVLSRVRLKRFEVKIEEFDPGSD